MYMAADYIHPAPHNGSCRVRIYRPDLPVEGSTARDEAVVICTELKDNPGVSVTQAAERIAGEVIDFHRLPTPLVWIEHYEDGARGIPEDPHTFDLVTFSSYEVEPGRVHGRGEEAHRGALLEAPGPRHRGGPGWGVPRPIDHRGGASALLSLLELSFTERGRLGCVS